uniref:RxLR effector candidate protein n=1 Tax=Globisporangium ultimum (strain ATCC 200006 / CBS 805.95 / DAOM BR144) TaxID=431595 RepID=K3X654_GLOUD
MRNQLNDRDDSNGSFVASERSPLLRALREDSSSFEGNYMSMPPPSSMESRLSEVGQFQPIVYAEKALAALLTGVLLYAICCILGLGLVSLNFEGILGDRVNWWLIFLPFWLANVCIFVGHIQSIRHAKKLRQWAEVDSMSNEPLLPLLRRIVLIYAISFPFSVLLLWSELAFCARLENAGTSLYICYAPIMVIQVAFVIRYLLCRSDSTLPGICWILCFVFTLLLAYQTDTQRKFHASEVHYPLSWWTVLAPLFTFQALMVCSLLLVLYNEFAGIYRLTRWQLGASVLYSLALVTSITGELMLLEHIDYHWGTFTFPSGLMFFGLVCASVGMYIVGRHHVEELMATRGGAVPVPLTRTTDGWITNHAVVEQWVLFGDIYLTPEGLNVRNQKAISGRRDSSVESEATGGRLVRRLKQLFGKGQPKETLTASDPERRIQNILRRKTSGSYSDITVEVIHTPKR